MPTRMPARAAVLAAALAIAVPALAAPAPAAAAPVLSVADVTVDEGDGGTTDALFTVSLSEAAAGEVTVQYATADGHLSGQAGRDYLARSGTLTFAPGVTERTVAVPVVGDVIDEPNREFFLELSSPSGATLDVTPYGRATIRDDDLPSVASLDPMTQTVAEGDTGTTGVQFTVTLDRPSGYLVRVRWDAAGRFAWPTTSGSFPDLDGDATGTLSFAPGETSQTFTASILPDVVHEPDEWFRVTLAPEQFATVAAAEATVTIADDDDVPARRRDTVRASLGPTGQIAHVDTIAPAISDDGRLVAFTSRDHAAAPGGFDNSGLGGNDVVVRDLETGVTRLVSRPPPPAPGQPSPAPDGESAGHAMSADGRFVAFTSSASNLVPGAGGTRTDVFVRDLDGTAVELISDPGAGDAAYGAALSPNGRYAAFVVLDGAGEQVWRRDRATGTLALVSAAADGSPATASPGCRRWPTTAPSRSRRGRRTSPRATPIPARTSTSATGR